MAFQGGFGGFDGEGDAFSASQFGGGNVGASQGFNSGFMSSSQGNQKKMNDSRPETIVPVTIRQILTCQRSQDDVFQVDGVDVHQVTVVGLIVTVTVQETKVLYQLDDGTGMIEVAKFIPSGCTDQQREEYTRFREFTYVRVYGALRVFDDKVNVVAFHIRLVDDFNMITFHLLECISVHRYNLSAVKAEPEQADHDMGGGGHAGPGMVGGDAAAMHAAVGDMMGYGEFTPVQSMVLKVAGRYADTEAGVSSAELVRECSVHPESVVREAIAFLCQEGHLYSTVDEDHFKSTV